MTTAAAYSNQHQKDPGGRIPRDAAGPQQQRTSILSSLHALYVLTLRQHLRGKRWMVLACLFLLPAGLAILLRSVAPAVPLRGLEFFLVFMFIPQALLPLVALIYASGIIRDEQEEQTITYLLVRPLPKWAIYIVKLVATMTTTALLTAVFTLITFVAVYSGGGVSTAEVASRCFVAAAIHSLAVVTYCSLFGLMSLFTRRILLAGVIYIAAVEGFFANFPFGIRLITVIYYARLIAYHSLNFTVTTPAGQTVDVAADAWQFDLQIDPTLVEHPQLTLCLIILATATIVFTLLAAWLCSQREFHVKTPEGV